MSLKPLRPLGYQHRHDQDFQKALNKAAKQYLHDNADHRFADGRFYAKSAALILCCLGSYFAALSINASWAFFVFYPCFICFALLLAINLVHDASHNAIFKHAKANYWLNFWVTLPLGLDPECWRVRHIIFHHAHTNIRHYDLDIEDNFVLRQTPYQRWYPFMRAQHVYWPLIAAMTFPALIWFFDWKDRFHFTHVAPYMRHQGRQGILAFIMAKLLHLVIAILIPAMVLQDISLSTLFLTYILSQMFASLIFVVLILGTHWAKATFYTSPKEGNMPHGFYTHTFSTTYDWQTTPRWLTYWLGGLNLHLTHHLFPNWNHRHYPALAEIIKQTAQQFSMDYHCISAKQLFIYQQQFLKEMGSGKQADKH